MAMNLFMVEMKIYRHSFIFFSHFPGYAEKSFDIKYLISFSVVCCCWWLSDWQGWMLRIEGKGYLN